jgi:hypothetical protein
MKKYLVRFDITRPNYVPRSKVVTLREGYSTFEDIRKILAIPLGVKVEEIDIMDLAQLDGE